ncbi:MAG: hypothetical protein AMXMBFR4_10940 [Candidatus Hydrogenedentota bacterium]
MSQKSDNLRRRLRGLLRNRWVRAGVAVLVVVGAVSYFRGGGEEQSSGTLFAARRGPLKITVLQGGNVEARESQVIRSRIKGETKILSIVEEGYLVTPEDVAEGKILVTLDNSQLIEKMAQHEIEYESARADLAETSAQYEIAVKQNESDIKKAELDAKFALLDFKKYLGEDVAKKLLSEVGLSDDVRQITADIRKATQESAILSRTLAPDRGERPAARGDVVSEEALGEGGDVPSDVASSSAENGTLAPESPPVAIASVAVSLERPAIDFSKYASSSALGDGEAEQSLRKLASDRLLAEEELGLAETKLAGTRKLAEKNFVTRQDLDNDEMSVRKNEVQKQAAMTAEELFVKYEFPKEAERLLSAYEEALRSLERTMKQALAKQAQAEARMKASEASYNLRANRRKELQEQLDACSIAAERPGLVVYGGSDEGWRNREPIAEGSTVYERQEIITIPDMTQMAVKAKIHESSIKKVRIGQPARIKLESYPDLELTGEVIKVSVLPDSGSRWMNPEMKVYPAIVSIEGTYEWLKPGMTASVEILVKEIADTVYVPIQAVSNKDGKRVCFVVNSMGRQEERVVETGEFNNDFIEIKSGLQEGEKVVLRTPQGLTVSSPTSGTPGSPETPDQRGGQGQRTQGGQDRGQPAAGSAQQVQGEQPQVETGQSGARPNGERNAGTGERRRGPRPEGGGEGQGGPRQGGEGRATPSAGLSQGA